MKKYKFCSKSLGLELAFLVEEHTFPINFDFYSRYPKLKEKTLKETDKFLLLKFFKKISTIKLPLNPEHLRNYKGKIKKNN